MYVNVHIHMRTENKRGLFVYYYIPVYMQKCDYFPDVWQSGNHFGNLLTGFRLITYVCLEDFLLHNKSPQLF